MNYEAKVTCSIELEWDFMAVGNAGISENVAAAIWCGGGEVTREQVVDDEKRSTPSVPATFTHHLLTATRPFTFVI